MTLKAPLSLAFLEGHPQSAAHVLESTPPDAAAKLLAQLPPRLAATTSAHMIPLVAAKIFCVLDIKAAAAILADMEGPAATSILRVWPTDRLPVFKAMPKRIGARLQRALSYASHLVGAHMDPTAPALDESMTSSAALARLETMDPVPDTVAVENASGKFIGLLSVRDLVAAPNSSVLRNIVNSSHLPLVDVQPLTTAIDLPAWREMVALPVVDGANRFVGMLHRRALDTGADDNTEPLPVGLQFSGFLLQVFQHCAISVAVMIADAFNTKDSERS